MRRRGSEIACSAKSHAGYTLNESNLNAMCGKTNAGYPLVVIKWCDITPDKSESIRLFQAIGHHRVIIVAGVLE